LSIARYRRPGGEDVAVSGEDNKARFERIVLPHIEDAYALARWITGVRADAEDVVQEAFLRAFRAIGGYAGGNTRAWTLKIVRNTAYTWLANNRTAVVTSVDDLELIERNHAKPGQFPGNYDANPQTDLLAKADSARLDEAIATLPVAFRETLVLRHVQGLDYREIAAITDVPVGTVMSRLSRARQRLIDLIGVDER
jgi:RNA polymerase sigma-70 factor (ECF subfamily)